MGTTATVQLTGRDRAILRAVGGGSAEMSGGCQPDLFLDGRSCCDQPAARRLARLGLIAAEVAGPVGRLAPAVLTPAGRAMITVAGGDTPPARSGLSAPARVVTGCRRVRSAA